MTFTQDELSLEVPCYDECWNHTKKSRFYASPDVMFGHLVEAHDYTVGQATEAVNDAVRIAFQEQKDYDAWYYEDAAYERSIHKETL